MSINNIIEQWIGEKEKQMNETHLCRFNDGEQTCDCYIEALTDLKSRIPELEEMIVGEIERIYILLAKEQIELCHGKLPYVIFDSKATEEESVQLYRKGLEDFRKHFINSLKGGNNK